MKHLPELQPMSLPKEWRMVASQMFVNTRDYGITPERALMVWRMGLDAMLSATDHFKPKEE